MTGKLLAAAFYLPPDGALAATGPLLEARVRAARRLLAEAGATQIAAGPAPGDRSMLIDCMWAGMSCAGYLGFVATMPLLVIFFPRWAFLAALPDLPDGDPEPAPALADAFARACASLRPDAAVVATRPHQAEIDALERLAGPVAEADVRRLAEDHFGLLYVSDKLADYESGAWYGPGRDVIPVEHGWLLFAGEGPNRWW